MNFASRALLQMLVGQLTYASVNSSSHPNLTSQPSPAVPSAYNAPPPPSICLGALWPLATLSALPQFSWNAQDRT